MRFFEKENLNNNTYEDNKTIKKYKKNVTQPELWPIQSKWAVIARNIRRRVDKEVNEIHG